MSILPHLRSIVMTSVLASTPAYAAEISGGGLQCFESEICIFPYKITAEKGDSLDSIARQLSDYTKREVTIDMLYSQNKALLGNSRKVTAGTVLRWEYCGRLSNQAGGIEGLF